MFMADGSPVMSIGGGIPLSGYYAAYINSSYLTKADIERAVASLMNHSADPVDNALSSLKKHIDPIDNPPVDAIIESASEEGPTDESIKIDSVSTDTDPAAVLKSILPEHVFVHYNFAFNTSKAHTIFKPVPDTS